jgi:hypothetical protein
MKKMTIGSWLILCFSIFTLSACGDSGNKSGQHQFTNALVKLSTATTATSLGGVDATILLPPGVTVSSTTLPPWTDSSVVVPSGQASSDASATGLYTAVTGTSPATVRVQLVSTAVSGFGPGEFVSVKCNISAGNYPTQSDFMLGSSPSTTVWDIHGAVISGATVSLSVSFL